MRVDRRARTHIGIAGNHGRELSASPRFCPHCAALFFDGVASLGGCPSDPSPLPGSRLAGGIVNGRCKASGGVKLRRTHASFSARFEGPRSQDFGVNREEIAKQPHLVPVASTSGSVHFREHPPICQVKASVLMSNHRPGSIEYAPSRRTQAFHPDCRAVVQIVAL